jgi:hypothetical protein
MAKNRIARRKARRKARRRVERVEVIRGPQAGGYRTEQHALLARSRDNAIQRSIDHCRKHCSAVHGKQSGFPYYQCVAGCAKER